MQWVQAERITGPHRVEAHSPIKGDVLGDLLHQRPVQRRCGRSASASKLGRSQVAGRPVLGNSPPRTSTSVALVFLPIAELEVEDLRPPASPLITRVAARLGVESVSHVWDCSRQRRDVFAGACDLKSGGIPDEQGKLA